MKMGEIEQKIIDALDRLYLEGIEIERATVTYKTKDGKFRFSFSQRKNPQPKGDGE